jgi:hypothetical protein
LLADPDCVTNEYLKQLCAQRRGYEEQLRSYELQFRAHRRAYEQQLCRLEQQLRAQRRAYEQSTSWRITAPLR